MKIAVIGTGGVGGYFGGRLAAAGNNVHLVARGDQLAALNSNGLHITSPNGDLSIPSVHATDTPATIGEVDLVLLGVKTWQLPAVIPMLDTLVGPTTAVVTTQNGVDAPEEVAAHVGRHAVTPGVAKVISFVDGPGRIRHVGGLGSLAVGEWNNHTSARIEEIRATLTTAGIPSPPVDDIWAELWAKFLFIVPFGSLGAVADAEIGVLRSRPGARQLLAEGMAEIGQIAAASNVKLPDDIVDSTLDFVDQQPAAATSSLHRDIRATRPSELEALTGAVVRRGAQTGTPTPVHHVLYEVLRLLQADVPPQPATAVPS